MRLASALPLFALTSLACSTTTGSDLDAAGGPRDALADDATARDAAMRDAGDAGASDAGAADGPSGDAPSDDASGDAAIDVGVDAFVDVDASVGVDAFVGIDAGSDAGSDAGLDTGPACEPTTETCFDGADQDCDGLVDCADPDCAPIAECVPDPVGLPSGTVAPGGATCPTAFSASTLGLSRGLVAPSTCSGCGCTGQIGCSTVVNMLGPTCALPAVGSAGASTLSCNFLAEIGMSGGLEVDPFTVLPYCNVSGRPAIPPSSWSERETFCGAAATGGGCGAGSVCAPIAPSSAQHCVTAADAASCPAGYAPQAGGVWYTGLTDTRSCGATCTCAASGPASCGTSYVALYDGVSTCASRPELGEIPPGTTTCTIPSGTARATAVLQGATTPTCSVTNTVTGGATPTGPIAVCCH